MPAFHSVRDGSLDTEAIKLAAEVYFEHREENGKEDHKWELFGRLEDWIDQNEISPDTVEEFVEKLEEENPDHPLVHWTHLDDLASAAQENPQRLSRLLKVLYDEDQELADRIDEFREAIPIGSDGIGYLLAAYNKEQYAPFKDEVFQTFQAYFTGYQQPSYDSLGDKYSLFVEYLSIIAELFENESYLRDVTALDAQDFIYTIIEYDEPANEYRLKYLFEFAQALQDFENDPGRLIDELHDFPRPYLRSQAEAFENSGKVREIRHRVASAILDDEPVTLEQFKREENEKHDKNIFNSWTDFTILAQLYLNFYKDRVDRYLSDLVDYIRNELQEEQLEAHSVTFQGPASFPQTRSWVALHPADQDFQSSYQLYLDISPDGIEFGLVRGSEIREDEWGVDTDTIDSFAEIRVQPIIEKYLSLLSEFERRNRDLRTSPKPAEYGYDELERFPELARQLKKSKQMVFYGPPGTGKTYAAVNFARWWIDEQDGDPPEQIETVTFHPSFTYEDFLEGLTATATEGSLTFEIETGIFTEFCRKAQTAFEKSEGSPPRYVLIIDEINRGNLASIFGETITLLEADKRAGEPGEMTTTLAHSGEGFSVPPNLYIVGTMNTADRSIALVDAALRRRFRFTAFPPDYDLLLDEYGFEDTDDAEDAALQRDGATSLQALSILALQKINQRILDASSLGRGKQIGHTYLLDKDGQKALVDAWKYEILPLLEEYYFGQSERLRTQIFDGDGDELFDWNTQQIRDFDAESLQSELQRLLDVDQ